MFTGYTYADPANPTAPATQEEPRVLRGGHGAVPDDGECRPRTSAKNLLVYPGTTGVVPAGQTPQQDLDAAVRNVFMHPNTPAYIGRQLIQRLVTGNPSPAYIAADLRRVQEQRSRRARRPEGGGQGDPAGSRSARSGQVPIRLRQPARAGAGGDRGDPRAERDHRRQPSGGRRQQPRARTRTSRRRCSTTSRRTRRFRERRRGRRNSRIHTTNTAVARANLVYTLVYNGYAPDRDDPERDGHQARPVAVRGARGQPGGDGQPGTATCWPAGSSTRWPRGSIVTAVNAVPISADAHGGGTDGPRADGRLPDGFVLPLPGAALT